VVKLRHWVSLLGSPFVQTVDSINLSIEGAITWKSTTRLKHRIVGDSHGIEQAWTNSFVRLGKLTVQLPLEKRQLSQINCELTHVQYSVLLRQEHCRYKAVTLIPRLGSGSETYITERQLVGSSIGNTLRTSCKRLRAHLDRISGLRLVATPQD